MSELYSTTLFSSANLIAYYRLEGNSNDSKNSNNGSDTNITYNASYGKYNQGASFNGSSSFISLGTGSSFDCDTTVSLVAWIYPTTVSGTKSIIHDATSGAAQGQYALTLSNQILNFRWGNGVTAATYATSSNVITTANTWYHVAGVRDGSGYVTLYVNGSSVSGSFTSGSNATAVYSSPQGLSIGRYGAYSGDYFSGYIDDVGIFNSALTAGNITELYRSTFIPRIIWF